MLVDLTFTYEPAIPTKELYDEDGYLDIIDGSDETVMCRIRIDGKTVFAEYPTFNKHEVNDSASLLQRTLIAIKEVLRVSNPDAEILFSDSAKSAMKFWPADTIWALFVANNPVSLTLV